MIRWLDRHIACPGPYLVLCLTQEQMAAAFRKLRASPPDGFILNKQSSATTYHLTTLSGKLASIVCFGGYEGRSGVEVAGLLVHEAVHVWQAYADHIGERSPGSEQEAYAIQSIAQELMTDFARQMEAA